MEEADEHPIQALIGMVIVSFLLVGAVAVENTYPLEM